MKKQQPSIGDATNDVVDFSFVESLADNKPDFMNQVLTIFMDNTPAGIKELEKLVRTTSSYEKISKQAHFLKSSFGIIKVVGVHEKLQQIETLAKEKKGKAAITTLLDEIIEVSDKAEIIIRKKMEQA